MSNALNNNALQWLYEREKKLFVEAHAESHVLQDLLESCPSFKQFYEARRKQIVDQVLWWRPSKRIPEHLKPAVGHAVGKRLKFPAGSVWTITLERIPAIPDDAAEIATELAIIIVSQNAMASIGDFRNESTLRHGWVIEQSVLEILAANMILQYGIKRAKISASPFGHPVADFAMWPEGLRNVLVFECFRQIMLSQICLGFGTVDETLASDDLSTISTDIETIRDQDASILEEAADLAELANQTGLWNLQGQSIFFQKITERYGKKHASAILNRNQLENADRERDGLLLKFRKSEDGILGPEVVFNGILIESCPDPFGLCMPTDYNNWLSSPEEVLVHAKSLLYDNETNVTLYNRTQITGRCSCNSGLTFLRDPLRPNRARVLLWQDESRSDSWNPSWPPKCPVAYDTIVFARQSIEMDSLGHRIRDSVEADVAKLLSQIAEASIENLQRSISERLLDWEEWFSGLAEIYEDPLGYEYLKDHGLLLSYLKTGDRMIAHCEDGPCVVYRDQFKLWALNGVIVKPELVETKANDLDPTMILEETNVEIRREIVRKIGIERVCAGLNAIIVDSEDGYHLLELDLNDGRRRPYLKMRNPSTGAWHIEGVHPNCTTVREALAWRNWTSEVPARLT